MSIKTTKRIALGVIAGLVFAPFAAIAPANALASAPVFGTAAQQLTVGQQITVSVGSTILNTDTAVGTLALTQVPEGSTVSMADRDGGNSDLTTPVLTSAVAGFAFNATNGAATITATPTAFAGTVTIIPDVSGIYTFTFTAGTVATTRILAIPSQIADLQLAQHQSITRADTDVMRVLATRPAGNFIANGTLRGVVVSSPDADLLAGAGIASVAATGSASAFELTQAQVNTVGTYQVRYFIDTNSNNVFDAGEINAIHTFTMAGIPDRTAVALASTSGLAQVNRVVAGTVTVTDSAGRATYLTGGNTLTVTTSIGTVATAAFVVVAQPARIAATNQYLFTIEMDTAAGGGGVAAPAAAYRSTATLAVPATTRAAGFATFTVLDGAAATATRLALTSQTGTAFGAGATFTTVIPADATAAADNAIVAGLVPVTADPAITSFNFTLTATAAKVYTVTTTPGANMATSRITAPATVTTLADGSVTFTVTVTTPTVTLTTADSFQINVAGTTDNNFGYAVTYANPTAVWTLNPAAAPDVLEKSTNKVTAKLTDSYGRVLGSTGYTVAVTGRNVSASTGVTDASGNAEFTLRDSATTSYALVGGFPTDTVTFTNVGTVALPAVPAPVTYTYKATLAAVGTVTVTVAADNKVIDQVEALAGAPVAGAIATYTATVRTAAGAAVGAGTLVTFAGSANDLFVDGISSGVTNANGQATASVYRQKVGFAAITATANTVVGSARAILWVNGGQDAAVNATAFGDHRNVSVSAAQTIAPGSAATVVATVVDRRGNAVSGITVTFSLAGVGRVPTGETLTKRTDINGSAQVQVTSLATETGVNTVTATISGGQTLDLAGFVSATTVTVATGVATANAAPVAVAKGSHLRTAIAGNRTASSTVTFAAAAVVAPVVPTVVVPPVAPTLTAERQGNRVLLFGTCMVDEGDIIIYVKSPGKAYSEKAKTLECADGEYDGSLRASKNTKFYRVKQEGTGLYSTSRLIRP